MDNSDVKRKPGSVAIASLAATAVASIGLLDSAYLTSKHFTGGVVPCSIVEGCEIVLTSTYSEIFGIPTAALGAVAYFVALSLAILTYFGNTKTWSLFGGVSTVMFLVSLVLIYIQAFVIGAFCQFCLLSATTSTLLFLIFFLNIYFSNRAQRADANTK